MSGTFPPGPKPHLNPLEYLAVSTHFPGPRFGLSELWRVSFDSPMMAPTREYVMV